MKTGHGAGGFQVSSCCLTPKPFPRKKTVFSSDPAEPSIERESAWKGASFRQGAPFQPMMALAADLGTTSLKTKRLCEEGTRLRGHSHCLLTRKTTRMFFPLDLGESGGKVPAISKSCGAPLALQYTHRRVPKE